MSTTQEPITRIYKLIYGETIIARFHGLEVVPFNNGEERPYHTLTDIRIINQDSSFGVFIPGVVDNTQPIMIPVRNILVYAEGDDIDANIKQSYHTQLSIN